MLTKRAKLAKRMRLRMAGRGLPAILAPLHIKNLQPLLIWPIVILFSPFQQAKKGKPYDTGAMPRNDKIKKVI